MVESDRSGRDREALFCPRFGRARFGSRALARTAPRVRRDELERRRALHAGVEDAQSRELRYDADRVRRFHQRRRRRKEMRPAVGRPLAVNCGPDAQTGLGVA